MKLLLLSNSTNYGESYLGHAKDKISEFLGKKSYVGVFIPFAAVTISYDDYEMKVKTVFNEIGYDIVSIHKVKDMKKAVEKAELIVVGGGNTFRLLQMLQQFDLLNVIADRVKNTRVPYIGWSAGANLACPTIMTTNDMPIVEPENFKALNLINFQINPHYTEKTIEGHGGESRNDRLKEFIELNRNIFILALPEGTGLSLNGKNIRIVGEQPVKIFKYGVNPYYLTQNDDLSFLL